MEVGEIIEMFKWSEELHNAKYVFYIGDGDSKTYSNLLDSNPYDDLIVTKLEYVNHMAKQMLHRLTVAKKRKTWQDKTIKDYEKKKVNL